MSEKNVTVKKTPKLFYSVPEVARILGFSEMSVLNWIYEGKIKAVRVSKRWRIPVVELKRIMKDAGIPLELLELYEGEQR